MSFCPSCGSSAAGGAFCASCGKTLPPVQQFNNTYQQASPMQQPYMQNAAKPSNTFSTLGLIFGGIALLFIPILFGVAGIIFSVIAKSKSEPNANLALGVSIGGTIAGMIIGALITSSFYF
jgi:uncharacterized membrane protein YvbJ